MSGLQGPWGPCLTSIVNSKYTRHHWQPLLSIVSTPETVVASKDAGDDFLHLFQQVVEVVL